MSSMEEAGTRAGEQGEGGRDGGGTEVEGPVATCESCGEQEIDKVGR